MTTAATVAHSPLGGQATHQHTWRYAGQTTTPRPGSACAAPLRMACRSCPQLVTLDCRATAAGKCEACAAAYRDRVRLVAKVPRGGVLLLTVTAPGSQAHYRAGQRCPCTRAGGVDLADWNARAGEMWNRLWNNGVLRSDGSYCRACEAGNERRHGVCRGCSLNGRYGGVRPCLRPGACDTVTVRPCERPASCGRDLSYLHRAYFRATEVQDRGALHFHVLLHFPDGAIVPPGLLEVLRQYVMRYGFGHEVDVQAADPVRAMHYVAKYVTKASGARKLVPWRAPQRPGDFTTDRDTGEVFLYRRRRASYRTWSASRAEARCWHRTMRDVVQAQQHFAATMAALPWWSDLDPHPVWALAGTVRPDLPDPGD